MSLARLALRLAAVESLSPYAVIGTGPWPTAAGAHVYNSRIDPIEAAKSQEEYETALLALENKPVITVFTEDDHNEPYGSAKQFADEQICTLIVEIMIPQIGQIEVKNAEGEVSQVGVLEAGATDSEREIILDTIDSQVRRVLDIRQNIDSLLRHVAMELRSIHDDPQRDAHRGARFALRTVKFHFKLMKETWGAFGTTPAEGIAGLPVPLGTLAACLPAGSSALAACETVATLLAPPPAAPPLVGIAVSVALDRDPQTDPPTIDEQASIGDIGTTFTEQQNG